MWLEVHLMSLSMNKDGNNLYDCCDCGYYTNPETADTKSVILHSHSYGLRLRRSLMHQRIAAG